uniref:Uncharacterized protein n=1 Tax=viral metagenome TaxID=1070528 RepID=A0A6C0C4X7_9ZZZZ
MNNKYDIESGIPCFRKTTVKYYKDSSVFIDIPLTSPHGKYIKPSLYKPFSSTKNIKLPQKSICDNCSIC